MARAGLQTKGLMIVLTGATGFVGSQLVEQFDPSAALLLVGRDAGAIARQFPDRQTCDYAALADRALEGAVFIHLAVRNNDRPGTDAEFSEANIDRLLEVAALAKEKCALRFINLCSTHALVAKVDDAYGSSKAMGAAKLRTLWPEGAVNLYVPAIYGTRFQGKLRRLNAVPASIRPLALALLRQLKPVLSIDHLRRTIDTLATTAPSDDPWKTEHYAADPVPKNGIFTSVQRLIDITAALAIAVLLSWAFLVIAVYIRLDSEGPAIFTQKRVGRYGRVFTCYKFRTMRTGTAQAGTHDTPASAITTVGAFLRRTKLDELPQVLNVLLNQMSLVGPRPGLPVQIELIERRRARDVFVMKPGITGLAQVNDVDMSDPAQLAAWDHRYGAFRTLLSNVAILIRTARGGGKGDRIVKT